MANNVVIKPGDLLVLRTDFGEMTFTGGECAFALQMAQRHEKRGGRAALVAHTKETKSAVLVWPTKRQENLAVAA